MYKKRQRISAWTITSVVSILVGGAIEILAEVYFKGSWFNTFAAILFVFGAGLSITLMFLSFITVARSEQKNVNAIVNLKRERRILSIEDFKISEGSPRKGYAKESVHLTHPNIFLSYAHEDMNIARMLYNELRSKGYTVWFDKESLVGGQYWKVAIKKAIRESRFFIALLSTQSVNKRGFVQSELKDAFDILAQYPPTQIFLLPVRLEECEPTDIRLSDLHWVDLFPNWDDGVTKIVKAIESQL